MENNLQKLFTEYIDECTYSKKLRYETTKSSRIAFEHFSRMMPEVTTTLSV